MSGNASEPGGASMLSASLSSIVTGHVASYDQTWVPNMSTLKALIDADTEEFIASQQAAAVAVDAPVDAPVDADLAELPAPAPFAAMTYGFTDDPAVEEAFDIPAELPEGYISPEAAAVLDEQFPAPELPPVPEALLTDYSDEEDDENAEAEAAGETSAEDGDALPALPDALTRDYDIAEEAEDEGSPEGVAEATEEGADLPAIPADLTREYDVPADEVETVEADPAAEPAEDGSELPEAHADLTREYDLPEEYEHDAVEDVADAFAEADLVEEVDEGPGLPEIPQDILSSVDGDVQPRPEWNPAGGSSTLGDLPPVPDFLSPDYTGSFLSPGETEEIQTPSDEAPSLLAGISALMPSVEENPYVPSSEELKESLAKFDPAAAMGMKNLDVPLLEDPNSDLPAGPSLKAAPSLTGEVVDDVVYNLDGDPVDQSAENYTASFAAGSTSLIAGLNDLSDLETPEEVENPFKDDQPDLSGFEPSRYFGLQNEYDPFNDALPQDEQSRILAGDMPAPVVPQSSDDLDVDPIVDQAKAAEAPRDSRAIMKMLRELNTLREA
jgi:hypothetical protein